ncbi:MAG: hypothetical protein U0414_14415 [Polyangiaceae bacterium]
MSKLAFLSISGIALLTATAQTAVAQQPPATPPGTTPAPAAPAPDAAQPPAPKPLIWRGTTFTFNQSVTSTAIGIGRDNIGGESEYYGMQWDVNPTLYVLDKPKDKIRLDVDAGVAVEITNSDTTTTNHEPYFTDLQFGAQYVRDIFTSEDSEWSTKGSVRTRFIFPTSPISFNSGKYLTFQLGGNVRQQIKLLGSDADGLNNLTVGVGLTWSHLFSRSYQPTNESLNRVRQNATGQGVANDILTSGSFDIDRLIPSLSLGLPLYKDLSLSVEGRLIGRFRHGWEGQDCEAQTLTGCVRAATSPDQVTYITNSSFDVSLSQGFYDVVDVTLGYNNETLSLGEDGQFRNPFYSPDAQFYLDISANIDEIYSKASGRSKFQSNVVSSTGMPAF